MRELRRLLGTVAVTLLLVTGCSGDDEPDAAGGPTSTAEAEAVPTVEPPFPVATVTEDLVDRTRATGERQLPTTIRYPDVDAGPFPVVVFAHGFMDLPDTFSELTTGWAAAGYVVAAPAFPRTRVDAEGGPDVTDLENQPGDVSFVIDEVARLSAEEGHALAGRADLERVGVAGHGLGVTTVLGPAFHTCCHDDRVDAVLALSGIVIDMPGTWEFSDIPLMVTFGDSDEGLPPTTGTDLYGRAQAPKLFVTITGGTHNQPYADGAHPADEAVETATARFWDHYLGGRASADDLLGVAAVDGTTALQHDLG